jgi:hypothetical protein
MPADEAGAAQDEDVFELHAELPEARILPRVPLRKFAESVARPAARHCGAA